MENKEYKNATIGLLANTYYDGKVNSRSVFLENGERKTLGVMLEGGPYVFPVPFKELMTMLNGEMDVLLPGETEYKTFKAGEYFNVPAHSTYKVIVRSGFCDYECTY